MRPPKFISELMKYSLMTFAYEDVEVDTYPLVLLDNEANAKRLFKNQYQLQEMIKLGENVFQNPIKFENNLLSLFDVEVLNDKSSTRVFHQYLTIHEAKLPLLQNPKCKINLFTEITQHSDNFLLSAIRLKTGQVAIENLFIDDLKHLLGVAIVAHYGFDEFTNIRKNNRNFLLKALCYVFFGDKKDTGNDAILPELKDLNAKHSCDIAKVYKTALDQMYEHYGLREHDMITSAFEHAAIFNEYKSKNYAIFLSTFENKDILNQFIEAGKLDTERLQHVFNQMLRKAKYKIKKEDVDFALAVLNKKDLSLEEFYQQVDTHFNAKRFTGIVGDLENSKRAKEKGVALIDLLMPVYQNYSKHYGYDVVFSDIICDFVLSKNYIHTEKHYQGLKDIISLSDWMDRDESLVELLSREWNDALSDNLLLKLSEKGKRFWYRLLKLLIESDSPIENWNFFLKHRCYLDHYCLSLDSKTFYEALDDCDSFDEYKELFAPHNPFINMINTEEAKKLFKVGDELLNMQSKMLKPIRNKTDFKAVVRHDFFKDIVDNDLMIDLMNGRRVILPIHGEKPHFALLVKHFNHQNINYCLQGVYCEGEIEAMVAVESIKVVQFLNKKS